MIREKFETLFSTLIKYSEILNNSFLFRPMEVVLSNEEFSKTLIQLKHIKSIKSMQKSVEFNFYVKWMTYRNESVINSPPEYNNGATTFSFHDRAAFITNDSGDKNQ